MNLTLLLLDCLIRSWEGGPPHSFSLHFSVSQQDGGEGTSALARGCTDHVHLEQGLSSTGEGAERPTSPKHFLSPAQSSHPDPDPLLKEHYPRSPSFLLFLTPGNLVRETCTASPAPAPAPLKFSTSISFLLCHLSPNPLPLPVSIFCEG